jgi:hypothetical protein
MGYVLKLHEKAHDEYIAAYEWYETRQKDWAAGLWMQ